MFREISVKCWSVSECSISRNFSQGGIRNLFCNFRFLNFLSHFKSIFNENQQNYTSLKCMFVNLMWSFEKFVDRDCRKLLKFREIVCFRNFQNYAKFRKMFYRYWPKLIAKFRCKPYQFLNTIKGRGRGDSALYITIF